MWHTLKLKNETHIIRIDHHLESEVADVNSFVTIWVSDFKQLWSERLQVSKLLQRWKVIYKTL